jgi:hypothetical protein
MIDEPLPGHRKRGFTLALLAVMAGLAGVWSEGVAETRSTRLLYQGKAFGAFWKHADDRMDVSATYWGSESLLMPGQERATPFAAASGTAHFWGDRSISSCWVAGPVGPEAVQVGNDLRHARLNAEVPGTFWIWSSAGGWTSTNVVARVRSRLESERQGPAGMDAYETYSPEMGLSTSWNGKARAAEGPGTNWSPKGRTALGVRGTADIRLFGDQFGRDGVALIPENSSINWGHVVATERGEVQIEQELDLAGRGVQHE